MAGETKESKTLEDFTAGNVQFSAEVYTELLKSNSHNFVVCPLSAEIILALVHVGAGGRTAQQLSTSLHLPESSAKIEQAFKELAPYLEGNEHYTLSSANKVYVKDGCKIKDKFKSTAVNVFSSEIQSIDFKKSKEAASEINKWIEEKTHNKINNMVKPIDLGESTRAVLINAMYFRGNWQYPFENAYTEKKPFYYTTENQLQVDMMEQTCHFPFWENSELNAKFLKMSYEGEPNLITMTIVLPNDKNGLSDLESRIGEIFAEPRYSYPNVHVVLPKFKIETSIAFNPILQALGIVDAFQDNADFRGILVDEDLKISKVIQNALIEVEEEGTLAAAATMVECMTTCSGRRPPPPKQFIADHPFIFYLKIKDVVFFIGRCISPAD